MRRIPSTSPVGWLEILALVTLTVLATGIRLRSVADWPLDGDEIQTIHEADSLGRVDRVLAARSTWFTGPALHLGFRVLEPLLGDPLWALRLLPLLAGALCLPLAWALVRPLYGSLAAGATVWLLTWSPVHFHVSTYGRYYAPVFLGVGCGSLLLWNAARRTERTRFSSLGALTCFATALAFHVTAAFTVAGALAGVLFTPGRGRLRRVGLALVVVALAALGPLVWLGPSTAWHHLTQFLDRADARTAGGAASLIASLVHDLGLAIPPLALLGLTVLWRRRERVPVVLTMAIPVALLALLATRMHVGPRYLYGAVLPIYVVAAVGLARLLEPLTRRPILAGMLLVLSIVPALPVFLSNALQDNSRFDVEAIARVLEDEHRPGEPVWAETHAITEAVTGLPAREMPSTLGALRRQLPPTGRAFFVVFFQRGVMVGTSDPDLQEFMETQCRMLDRHALKRFDMHRFEVRLCVWDGDGLSISDR